MHDRVSSSHFPLCPPDMTVRYSHPTPALMGPSSNQQNAQWRAFPLTLKTRLLLDLLKCLFMRRRTLTPAHNTPTHKRILEKLVCSLISVGVMNASAWEEDGCARVGQSNGVSHSNGTIAN